MQSESFEAAEAAACALAAVAVCSTAQVASPRLRGKRSSLPNVIPPLRFALVEAGVYRGGYPVLFNYRFMKRLNLKTIISLIPEEPTQDLKEYCLHEDVKLTHVQSEKFKEAPVLPMPEVTQILETIIDPRNHPVYIHCLDGGHVTGSIIVALRRLQGWETKSIVEEHERWTVDREVTSEEMSYIEEFHNPCLLTLPVKLPGWLWDGSCVDSDDNRKRNKLFSRLKYPAGVEEVKLAAIPDAGVVVGSLDTLYSADTFLENLSDLISTHPTPQPQTMAYPTLWDHSPPGDISVTLSRSMQALWLDCGPAGACYIESPPKLRQAASSYSNLRSLLQPSGSGRPVHSQPV